MARSPASPSWVAFLVCLCSMITIAVAYRPVQHCKIIGENGHYSACTSFTQYYNTTSQESDLYVRYQWYKYKDSKNGWHAVAIGEQMAGAYMLVMYGDPTSKTSEMTVSVRSATGHEPPRPILEIGKFQSPQAEGRIPPFEVITSKFQSYDGPIYQEQLKLKPSHVGIAEVIIRGYSKWIGVRVSNISTSQPMLWSSNYQQDFAGDYSFERAIDMHAFGLGFGWLKVDLLNAETPLPMFGPITEVEGLKGVKETGDPDTPTKEELSDGDKLIANVNLSSGDSEIDHANDADKDKHNPFDDHNTTPTTVPVDSDAEPDKTSDETQSSTTPTPAATDAPPRTFRGKTVRDWMWHLHGLLMSTAFLFLLPLGVYFIRSPRPDAFNLHWTVQSLGTVCLTIGAVIGWVQSRSISVWHQYVGLLLCFFIAAQLVLGWRHHVIYVATKRRTWMISFHKNIGRFIVFPFGLVNVITGMVLRQYGNFTLFLMGLTIIAEVTVLGYYLYRTSRSGNRYSAAASELKDSDGQTRAMGDDAEEYFQLAGEDDDEFSDDDDFTAAGASDKKGEEKRGQNARLAKLDRV